MITYNVKRATTPGGPFTTIASGLAGKRFFDATAAGGVTYYYLVTAEDENGESAGSNVASAAARAAAAAVAAAAGAARIQGSCLSFPVRPDARGTLACVSDRAVIVEQSIRSIIETRQGERVMMPDYGIQDFAFAVKGVGFAAAVAYFVRSQILKYEPLVETADVRDGSLSGGEFSPQLAADEHSAALAVTVTIRGGNTPLNLVFPLWEYRPGVGAANN